MRKNIMNFKTMEEVKNITELSETIKQKLYSLRFKSDTYTPIEQYIDYYDFILVEETIYCKTDEDMQYLIKRYAESATNIGMQFCYPHAIIKNGKVFKNRFGVKEL